MSRLSADPATMAREAQVLGEVAAGLDGARSAVVQALLQVATVGGSGQLAAAADGAAQRWAATLSRSRATASDLGVAVRGAAACYREVEQANTMGGPR